MSVQRVKLWQWIIISLVLGSVAGFFLLSSEDLAGSGTLSRSEFYRLVRQTTEEGKPRISQIVISPVFQDATGRPVQRVNFVMRVKNVQSGAWEEVAGDTTAEIPYLKTSDNKDNRIGDFLADLKKERPDVEYRFAWWQVTGLKPSAISPYLVELIASLPWLQDTGLKPSAATWIKGFFQGSYPADRELYWWQYPRGAWILLLTTSVLVIGIAWPMVIRLLVKLGFGLPEEEAGVDLSKVSSGSSLPMATRAGMTAEDEAKLDDLNARLESNVEGMMVDDKSPDEAAERAAEEATIKKLSNQPAEATSSQPAAEKPKDYAGEFYPVAKPGSKEH